MFQWINLHLIFTLLKKFSEICQKHVKRRIYVGLIWPLFLMMWFLSTKSGRTSCTAECWQIVKRLWQTSLHLTAICFSPALFAFLLHEVQQFPTFWCSHHLLCTTDNPTIPHTSLPFSFHWEFIENTAHSKAVDMCGNPRMWFIYIYTNHVVCWNSLRCLT